MALYNVPYPHIIRITDGLNLNFSDKDRESIIFISEVVREDLKRSSNRIHVPTAEQKMLIALRYLASGNFLLAIGDTLVST